MLNLLANKKNYLFALAMMAAGAINYFVPELQLSILGQSEPSTLVSMGIAWALGRNALAKLQ